MSIGPDQPKAILIDYGNTLVQTGNLAYAAQCLDSWPMLSRLKLCAIGERVSEIITNLDHPYQDTQPDYIEVWRSALEANDETEIDPEAFALDHLLAFYSTHFLYPHVKSLLKTLKCKQIPIAIGSNITGPSAYLERTLSRLGIDSYIDTLVCSSDIGYRKPSEMFFECAIRKADWSEITTNQILMVGDNEITDVDGGNKAGFTTVLVSASIDTTGTSADYSMTLIELRRWATTL